MRHFPEYEWSLYIYSAGDAPEARQDLEDDLEEILGDMAEVSGGGQGERGWNIDIELYVPENLESAIDQIRTYLQEKNVSRDTYIRVIRSDRRPVYDAR